MTGLVPVEALSLTAALARAKKQFAPIVRDKKVSVRSDKGSYTFQYAPLERVLEATVPALSAESLDLNWETNVVDNRLVVTAVISHASGDQKRATLSWPVPGKIQELGSVTTYLKRYTAEAVLGVSAQADDDGNFADGNSLRNEPKPEATDLTQPLVDSLTKEILECTNLAALSVISARLGATRMTQTQRTILKQAYARKQGQLTIKTANGNGAP